MGKRGPLPDGAPADLRGGTQKKVRPPADLTPVGKKLFKEMVADNIVKSLDAEAVALLHQFCASYESACLAVKDLNERGHVIEMATKYGTAFKKNPWFDIKKESISAMTSISTKLRQKGVAVKPKGSARSGLMFGGGEG